MTRLPPFRLGLIAIVWGVLIGAVLYFATHH